jgi:hypothetical protein
MSGNLMWQDTVPDLFRSFKSQLLDHDNLIHLMFAKLLDKVAYAISRRDYVQGGDASEGTDYKALLACFIFTPQDMTEVLTKFYSQNGF